MCGMVDCNGDPGQVFADACDLDHIQPWLQGALSEVRISNWLLAS
jgi:hypothetical protein